MANSKPVGVAYSDPELTAGTTIAGAAISGSTLTTATITSPTITGSTLTTATITAPAISAPTLSGQIVVVPQILAAAGATQGTAGVITGSYVIVTVTASTQGVKLPTAATGKYVQVFCPGTKGVLVYPFAGDKISTASTNASVLLVLDKANIYVAKDAITWVVQKGA